MDHQFRVAFKCELLLFLIGLPLGLSRKQVKDPACRGSVRLL